MAFSTKSEQYCFNRMPFGIASAPGTFQKLMNKVLGSLNWKDAVLYSDLFVNRTRTHKKIKEYDITNKGSEFEIK